MAGLTAKRVARLLSKGAPGRHFDGQGLYLVLKSKAAAHWERRYMLHGREHYIGLGSAFVFGLAEARERNRRKVSQLLADGIDPLRQKREQRAAQAAQAARDISFGECAEEYFKTNLSTWKHSDHVAQWASTVLGRTKRHQPVKAEHDYCRSLRRMPVAAIDTPVVRAVLRPHWYEKPETMSRLRGRIEAVLDSAKALGYRSGDNPAAWDVIGKLLPARSKIKDKKRQHFAAIRYNELPSFMLELRQREGNAARALEFLILTAARTSEVLQARWPEIDLDEKIWTLSAERMKGAREHLVPLSPQAIELLNGLYREEGNDLVFIGTRRGKPMSAPSMLQVLRRMGRKEVPHGFRSSFSDWGHETTGHSNHAIEISLAHAVGAAQEQAYRRGAMLEKRRRLMEAWASYCTEGKKGKGEVLPLRKVASS